MSGSGSGTPSAPPTAGEPRTIAEIAEDVLRALGELPTGQTAKAADLALCERKYGQVYQMLQAPELLADWAELADIPAVAVDPIVALVAERLTSTFSVEGQLLLDLKAGVAPAMDRLRANAHTNYVAATTEMEYF